MKQHIRDHMTNYIVAVICMLVVVVMATQVSITFDPNEPVRKTTIAETSAVSNPMMGNEALPEASRFRNVAETESLQLHLDEASGHFMVIDKRSGNAWYSFPHPDHWANESTEGAWQDHLRSPLMIQTLDFSNHNAKPTIKNWITDNGAIANLEPIPGGVRLDYVFTKSAISITVEISIDGDSLQTKILDDRIRESGLEGLLWVRLFPFLGAEHSVGQEGYLFIPDGSGAIIDLNQPVTTLNKLYQEYIYGQDLAYVTDPSTRRNISVPVYGMKSGSKAFLAVVNGGSAYAQLLASPAKANSDYNWVTSEMRYRSPFRQVTNRSLNRSFLKYDKDYRFASDRSTRYYFLDGDQASYAGMATRYRQVLMEEEGYTRVMPKQDDIPLYVTIVGGDSQPGTFGDEHVPMTTTSEAMQMVQKLYGMGIENMTINLLGWQKNGFHAFGGILPVDRNLGGNEGMKYFLDFTRFLDIPVTYGVNYLMNNTGAKQFVQRHHGVRDLSGTVIHDPDFYDDNGALVSHNYIIPYMQQDLDALKEIGFDGVTFGGGYRYGSDIGQLLVSDYNSNYGANRQEAIDLQQHMLHVAKQTFDVVNTTNSFFYANGYADHIFNLQDDYSHDLFSERAVPFMQIALHGLVTYTSNYINEREEYTTNFLRDIEYGSLPAFIFTSSSNDRLRSSRGLRLFNSRFADWDNEVVEQYQKYNRALGDVQSEFIADHRKVADDIFETTYSNGKRVIVNYSDQRFAEGEIDVAAQNYQVIGGTAQ